MGEFSLPHIIIVLVIVLVFFGPSRLPGLGKSLGEAIRGFKQGIDPNDNKDVNNQPNTQQSLNRPGGDQTPGPTQSLQSDKSKDPSHKS